MKASTGEEITENSTPNLDDWGWDKFWLPNDWINWHKVMKAKKGKAFADTTFLTWWNKQTMFANMFDARTFNMQFRTFLKNENLLDAVSNVLTKPLGTATDLVSSGSNLGSNLGTGAEKTAKILGIVIPVAIVIAALGLTMYAYKKFIK